VRLLRSPDFRLLALSNGLSSLGDELALVALTIKVFELSDGSGIAVAAVLLAGVIPLVVFAPLAGLIVDLRSPLNLTDNFDGQRTGQHGLWVRIVEKLPQAVGKDLKLSPDAANYLDNPKEYVFSIMLGSYVWLDNILYLEELARRGKTGYGDPYFEDLARKVGPILRQQVLSPAAEDAGSYWYTAWTVAGRPDLK